MPSIARQTVEELGGPGSVLVRQRRDHERLDGLLHQLQKTEGAEEDEVLVRVCRLVFTHAFAEESVLWPAMRRSLSDGEQLTLRVEREHQEITEVVAALERSDSGSVQRANLVARAVKLLREDMRDEEDDLFPRLQSALGPGELRQLGRQWEAVRRIAPTRSHPTVSRRPPGNVLAALPLSAIDRTRDVLDDRAPGSPEPFATAQRMASRALASLAGAIEHLPPFRRGEDPSTGPGRTQHEA